jgi:hypothetical protein
MEWMMNYKRMRKNEVVACFKVVSWNDWGKVRNYSVKLAGLRTVIRIQGLPIILPTAKVRKWQREKK